MVRRTLAILMLMGAAAAPLGAEVKYTMRMELKKSAAPPAAANPMFATIGSMVTEMMVPGGSVELAVVMGERGTRIEANKALTGLPQGSVLLQRPDGSVVVLNTQGKTYWKSGPADAAGVKADVKRTGEFSTIAGERVERVTFRFEVPIGGEAASSGMPPLTIEGDAWIAEKYKAYTAPTAKAGFSPGGVGFRQLAELGLSLRQVMRSAMFGDQEIESTVSSISEGAAAASLFEVPADYKEVAGPGRIGG